MAVKFDEKIRIIGADRAHSTASAIGEDHLSFNVGRIVRREFHPGRSL
jgi:hypothetical protein